MSEFFKGYAPFPRAFVCKIQGRSNNAARCVDCQYLMFLKVLVGAELKVREDQGQPQLSIKQPRSLVVGGGASMQGSPEEPQSPVMTPPIAMAKPSSHLNVASRLPNNNNKPYWFPGSLDGGK